MSFVSFYKRDEKMGGNFHSVDIGKFLNILGNIRLVSFFLNDRS